VFIDSQTRVVYRLTIDQLNIGDRTAVMLCILAGLVGKTSGQLYPVLPMGKTDCFTQFYPILPNWFYPLGKTYPANTASLACSVVYCWSYLQHK